MTVANKVLTALLVGLAGLLLFLDTLPDSLQQVSQNERGGVLTKGLGWMVLAIVVVVGIGVMTRRLGVDHRIKALSIGVTVALAVSGRAVYESMQATGQVQLLLALLGVLLGGLALVLTTPTIPSDPKSRSAFPPEP
jgi:hypothetical protein